MSSSWHLKKGFLQNKTLLVLFSQLFVSLLCVGADAPKQLPGNAYILHMWGGDRFFLLDRFKV